MTEDVLLVERAPEGYAVLTLNRPHALNAWSIELCQRFCAEFAQLQSEPEMRVLILTGNGRAFSAGLDVKEMRADPDRFFAQMRASSPAVAIAAGHKPLIGAINGDAITGGFELSLLCDILIVSETARFADTHTRIGLMPGWGISQHLSRRVGIGRAKEISLTGKFIDAKYAASIGLVNRVVPPSSLLEEARRLAREMLGGVPEILMAYRKLIDDGFAMPLTEGLRLEHERRLVSRQRPAPA